MNYKDHPLKGLIKVEDLTTPVVDIEIYNGEEVKIDKELSFITSSVINKLYEINIWDEEYYICSKNDRWLRNEFSGSLNCSGIRTFCNRMFYFYQLQKTDKPEEGYVKYCTKLNKDGTYRYGEAKLGKVLKKMFPMLSDTDVESIVNEYKVRFLPIESEVMFSENIATVCKMPMSAKRTGFNTTRFMKSLSDSCMRYSFSFLRYHPMEAYESGDFEIAYLLDEKGKLAARTIVRKSNKTYAPIYTVSLPYGKALSEQLDSKGYFSQEDYKMSWVGARLSYIRGDYLSEDSDEEYYDPFGDNIECVILPYVDIIPTMYGRVIDDAWIEICSIEEIVGDDEDKVVYATNNYLEDTFDYCEDEPDLGFKYEYIDLKNSEGYYEC